MSADGLTPEQKGQTMTKLTTKQLKRPKQTLKQLAIKFAQADKHYRECNAACSTAYDVRKLAKEAMIAEATRRNK